jgi:hypothetical protein
MDDYDRDDTRIVRAAVAVIAGASLLAGVALGWAVGR